MEKFARGIFSIRMMALGMLVFLLAIGFATFLETKFDTQTAKIIVYHAVWFELLLVYLTINLIVNVFRFRMFRAEKIAILMFHLSFIVMLIGAGVTRYVSFEGLMIIKEGQSSNFIYSSDPFLWYKINDGKLQYVNDHKTFMSEITNNYFNYDVAFPNHDSEISIEYVNYQKNLIDTLVTNDSISESCLEIVTDGMKSNFVAKDGFVMIGEVALSFEKKNAMPGIQVIRKGGKVLMESKFPIEFLAMAEMQRAAKEGFAADSLYQKIPIDTLVPLQTATLYRVGEQQFVFKSLRKHTKMLKIKAPAKNMGADYLTIKVTDGKKSKIVELKGGQDAIPVPAVFDFNGLVYEMEYGSKRVELPFSIMCEDFKLDRYPGSDAPSSFSSDVVVIDDARGVKKKRKIFMNNVLDYEGYRFFQSGYEPDESGTHLSVNYDWWGTNISYLGYLMMGIGMLLSIFSPAGRFRELNRLMAKTREKREKITYVIAALILSTSLSFAEAAPENPNDLDTVEHNEHDGHDHSGHDHDHDHAAAPRELNMTFNVMSEEHSDEMASLLVQNVHGRTIPMHTLCDQLLRKVYRNNKYKGYNAVQTIMSMHRYWDYWQNEDVIYVSSKGGIREKLGLEGKYASFQDLLNEEGYFKLADEYNTAHQTMESKRGEFEKQVLKLGEKFQIMGRIFSIGWDFLKVLPIKDEPNNKWSSMLNFEENPVGCAVAVEYLKALDEAYLNQNAYSKAKDKLDDLKTFQRKYSSGDIPSEAMVDMEIRYNKMNIFHNAMFLYLILGFLVLIIYFTRVFIRPTESVKKIFRIIGIAFTSLTAVVFFYHGYGIYMRMMISGHAPWSDGYEAMVFIAWMSMLVAFLFLRKNYVILAAGSILAFLILMVADMNLLDPEVTNLAPVLKSYWLMIHVAIITGSYAPLGLSFTLGLISLILYIFRGHNNGKIVGLELDELTYISEMIMTIGLFMLAIGTFLGGIWANESWGRYWGWDPKETWALVAILVYAIILHLRFIPALKDKFTFNVLAFWGFASILFTFFGVNFYLVGLHSYANGEGLAEFPQWLKYMVVVLYIFTEFASIRNQLYVTKGNVSTAYFKKKLALLIGFVIFTALMLSLLKVTDFGAMIMPLMKIIGLILLVNGIQYGFTYLRPQKNSEKELDQI